MRFCTVSTLGQVQVDARASAVEAGSEMSCRLAVLRLPAGLTAARHLAELSQVLQTSSPQSFSDLSLNVSEASDPSARAGGQEKWRVIAVAAGGRHTLALAMPDTSGSDRGDGEATRQQGPSMTSSLGASPQDSDDQDSTGSGFDEDVELGALPCAGLACAHN